MKKLYKYGFEGVLFICVCLLLAINVRALTEITLSNNQLNISINVKSGNQLSVLFVKIDDPIEFNTYINNATEYLEDIYPVEDAGIKAKIYPINISSAEILTKKGIQLPIANSSVAEDALYEITQFLDGLAKISKVDKVVAIVPPNYIENVLFHDAQGITMNPLSDGVIVEPIYKDVVAHELSHTTAFILCDENTNSTWSTENANRKFWILGSGCPNGDKNGDNMLDSECLPNGCPTFTLGRIVEQPENEIVYYNNLMGKKFFPDVWISNDSYSGVLNGFEMNILERAQQIAVLFIRGKIRNNGALKIEPSYVLSNTYITSNMQQMNGNYSIILINGNETIYSINFTPIYSISGDNLSDDLTNSSYFSFSLPYNQTFTKILFTNKSNILSQFNVTQNTPTINITYPDSAKAIENKVNITWNATDADGDAIYYAVLISEDGGGNYTTLDLDLNRSYYELDPNDFTSGSDYVVKILATDGINTGSNVTGKFTLGNPLSINSLQVVSTNSSSNVFEFEIYNNGTEMLADIGWKLNAGNGIVINSTQNSSLTAGETLLAYVAFNYSTLGEYTVSLNASAPSKGINSIKTLSIGASTLFVNGLQQIYSNLSYKTFGFVITNNASYNANTNWTLNLGDNTIVPSTMNITLSPGEQALIYAAHQYASQGDYSVTATAQAGTSITSSSIPVEVEYLGVSNFSIVSSNGSSRVFEAALTNYLSSNLSNVTWNLNTGKGNISSVIPAVLQPQERTFAYVEYNYTAAGSFVANFSAVNKSYVDWELLNVTVT
jgi:hypothetical protein